ncbi:MAG: signal peptidase I [Sodaliphilus pleomorphus]|nr:signal peptidase I [Sodaliphilus pleomorphus]MDD7065213.1 signal peptidase I [Sodaliphilus pleomorphus]MDY2833506.1 signal peptidase I [Sodaliphilus pleomorphus]
MEENKNHSQDKAEQACRERQSGSLRERLARVKPTRWARFAIVSVIFLAWVAWLGSWWVVVFWPLLADIYLTQYVPWDWWKYSKSQAVRTVMSWVDAIVYALVLVYFLFLFVGQNYQIPSSSLEKTLLTGDYLWVNKMVYGPRVPQTPLHFPLAQNTLPGGIKSYIEWPQWRYHRLKGVRKVQRGDIVVFNFPCGDTVTTKVNNPDFYHLVALYGADAIYSDPATYGKVVWRPVDRRDAYVKRCIGLPGETVRLVNGTVYINGKALPEPMHMQRNYVVITDGTAIAESLFDSMGVSREGQSMSQMEDGSMGKKMPDGSLLYVLPLTRKMVATLKAQPYVKQVQVMADADMADEDNMMTYPVGVRKTWTHNNYGPLWIPKKGATLKLTTANLPYYIRVIRTYEGNTVAVKGSTIYINGKPARSYTFKMDYYWMMGDNRDNSSDSRYWGFVPEDHIIGTPMFVIISFDKDKAFPGNIRWNRLFIDANPDK